MNPVTKALSNFGRRLKYASIAFTNYNFPGLGWRTDWTKPWGNRKTGLDYQSVDVELNSIVMACVNWICRTYPEAPLQVLDDQEEEVKRHPMVELIRRPNPYYSGRLLWSSTLKDFNLTGNAYWLKVRSGAGRTVQLWYTPSFLICPKWPEDGSEFISHYEYNPAGKPIRIEVDEVVHFRDGLNAQTRCGVSRLTPVLAEIYTDQEAATFTGTLLKNLGIPGVVISPDDKDTDIDTDAAQVIKDDFKEKFSGDRRGEPMVLSGMTKVQVMGFSPEQMDLGMLRKVPEERVSGVIGVPAIVAGLGAGLERSTFANMAEAREMAYESNIIPTQSLMAEELEVQLLPDFEANPGKRSIVFDNSKVRVLQEDENQKSTRILAQVAGGLIMLGEGRTALGYDAEPEHDLYYVPNSVTPTLPAELGVAPEPPTAPAIPTTITDTPMNDQAPLKRLPLGKPGQFMKAAAVAAVADADEAERLFEARLQLIGSNGRG